MREVTFRELRRAVREAEEAGIKDDAPVIVSVSPDAETEEYKAFSFGHSQRSFVVVCLERIQEEDDD